MVDEVWHQTLLHTKCYSNMCSAAVESTANVIIDHNPDGADDGSARAQRYRRTLEVYEELFDAETFWVNEDRHQFGYGSDINHGASEAQRDHR